MSTDRIVYVVKASTGATLLATFHKPAALALKGRDDTIQIHAEVVDVTEVREKVKEKLDVIERLVVFPDDDAQAKRNAAPPRHP